MYKLLKDRTDAVVRVLDGATIPNNPDNKDWVEYQAWLQLGNLPEGE
jgi:hypothetical protein